MFPDHQQKILLVDGNNIIHAWDDLRSLHRARKGAAHTELCRRLTLYQDATDIRVVVVFDGRGSRTEVEDSGVQIFRTDSGKSADYVVERLTAKYASTYGLTVATSDVAEQDTVIALGAEVLSATQLEDELERVTSSFRKTWNL